MAAQPEKTPQPIMSFDDAKSRIAQTRDLVDAQQTMEAIEAEMGGKKDPALKEKLNQEINAINEERKQLREARKWITNNQDDAGDQEPEYEAELRLIRTKLDALGLRQQAITLLLEELPDSREELIAKYRESIRSNEVGAFIVQIVDREMLMREEIVGLREELAALKSRQETELDVVVGYIEQLAQELEALKAAQATPDTTDAPAGDDADAQANAAPAQPATAPDANTAPAPAQPDAAAVEAEGGGIFNRIERGLANNSDIMILRWQMVLKPAFNNVLKLRPAEIKNRMKLLLEKPNEVSFADRDRVAAVLLALSELSDYRATDEAKAALGDSFTNDSAKTMAQELVTALKKVKKNAVQGELKPDEVLILWFSNKRNKNTLAKFVEGTGIVANANATEVENQLPEEAQEVVNQILALKVKFGDTEVVDFATLKTVAEGANVVDGQQLIDADKKFAGMSDDEKKKVLAVLLAEIDQGDQARKEELIKILGSMKEETADEAERTAAKNKLKAVFIEQLAAVNAQADEAEKKAMFTDIDDTEILFVTGMKTLKAVAAGQEFDAKKLNEFLDDDDAVAIMRVLILVSQVPGLYNALPDDAKAFSYDSVKVVVANLSK